MADKWLAHKWLGGVIAAWIGTRISMRTLGLDTAGEMGSVGVIDGPRVLGELTFSARADHGAKLTPAVDATLRLADLSQRELDLICLASGPGSFTGLRIGLAFAKGLARALGIPLLGVPTLDAYAERARFWPGDVWVLFPDRRESVYAAVYREGRAVVPAEAGSIEALIDAFPGVRSGNEPANGEAAPLAVGPGALIHRDALQNGRPDVVVGSPGLAQPSGATVAQLGLARDDLDGANELYDLEPSYAQGPPVSSTNANATVTAKA